MPKNKEELQRQLNTFKQELKDYEAKLERAKQTNNRDEMVNYAMTVAGLKNSIKEIGTQLRSM